MRKDQKQHPDLNFLVGEDDDLYFAGGRPRGSSKRESLLTGHNPGTGSKPPNQVWLILHMQVHLNDLNDNAPILPALPPVVIQAGSSRRRIAQMNATDIDADDSIKYKIIHVSNNGKRKFYVNPSTGDLEVHSKKGLRFKCNKICSGA